MIKINTKEDPLLAKDFPSDPYSDLNIITSTQTFNLQQAFLAMDSEYFAKVDTPEIDLSQLKQEPLQKVLRSLYGELLVANSIGELVQLYHIINFLQIQDYKKNIVQEVKQRKDILQSLQFLELSYRQKICWERVLDLHLENKLKMLEDSKNYLQLSKIGTQTFDLLLTSFLKRYGESENKILNNVMQNYFNRKSIKPMTYLKNPALSKLQAIWLKYHHVPINQLNNQVIPNIGSSPLLYIEESSPKFGKQSPFFKTNGYDESIENKRKRVIELEKEISYKDNIIFDLTQQIDEIKRQIGLKPEICKTATVKSLLIEVQNGEKDKGTKKKRLQDLLGERNKDSESVTGQHQKPEPRPKQVEANEIKPLHRLGSKNMKKM